MWGTLWSRGVPLHLLILVLVSTVVSTCSNTPLMVCSQRIRTASCRRWLIFPRTRTCQAAGCGMEYYARYSHQHSWHNGQLWSVHSTHHTNKSEKTLFELNDMLGMLQVCAHTHARAHTLFRPPPPPLSCTLSSCVLVSRTTGWCCDAVDGVLCGSNAKLRHCFAARADGRNLLLRNGATSSSSSSLSLSPLSLSLSLSLFLFTMCFWPSHAYG
jgi:hypothetical protein